MLVTLSMLTDVLDYSQCAFTEDQCRGDSHSVTTYCHFVYRIDIITCNDILCYIFYDILCYIFFNDKTENSVSYEKAGI